MNILTNLSQAWSEVYQFVPTIESVENNPQFVQIAPPNEMILLVSLYVTIAKTEGFLNICWPSSLTEPFMDKLSSRTWFTAKREQLSEKMLEDLKQNVKTMKMKISAILGEAILSVKEILDLEVGDVIRLQTHKDDDVMVEVQSKPKFMARPGVFKGYRAVKVTRILKPEVEENEQ